MTTASNNDLIVGIDLGTTNSVLAIVKDGVPEIIRIEGHPTMPSCVGLGPDGELIVGQRALNQLVASPESTVQSIKREMGTNHLTTLGAKSYSPEEISSFILRELKNHAEAFLGQPVQKAVITVPAFFDEAQRQATKQAATLAGLEAVRIINEPTAAALAYDAASLTNEKLLVYDLGGGTFDVSVVVVEDGVVEVKASFGDTRLGGDDFDQCLIDHTVAAFKKKHGIDVTTDLKAMRRLKVILERAKCTLTDEPYVKVEEDYLSGNKHLKLEISRSEYEEMIDSYLQKTLTCIHKAMTDAGLVPHQLDKILLVGGASRTPAVARLIETQLKIEPRFDVDPDLAVALGAGIQAATLSGAEIHSILVDITPHTFSTSTIDFSGPVERKICVPLIKRNSPLPTAKSEAFYTLYHGQEEVRVDVYQGEHVNPDENTLIGDFLVRDLSNVPAGNPIILKFDLDLNNMLKVTATEKISGKTREVVMDTREHGRHFDLNEARDNIRGLVGKDIDVESVVDDDDNDEDDYIDTEDSMLATAKDLRKRCDVLIKAGLNEEDASQIEKLLRQSTEAIRDRSWDALLEVNDTLSDVLFYLED
ncbi:MAG: Hsp70 family protein [Verrucomicrobia bacterium]|nr:Hsp70 family protein [Verrucomicrobiota bacterium]